MYFPLAVRIRDRLAVRFPEAFSNPPLDLSDVNAVLATALEIEAENDPIIRIYRLYIFEGPRQKVEDQISRSLGDGTRVVNAAKDLKIHVATLGDIATKVPDLVATSWSERDPMPKTVGDVGGMAGDARIIQALKNYGADVECGACMEIAFTGVTTNEHTCDRDPRHRMVVGPDPK